MSEQPIRLMVVDDEAAIRRTLAAIVDTDKDLEVRAQAPDGRQALAALDRQAVDVVLLDIQMPNLDGLDTLDQIRQRGHRARVLMLTTFGEAAFVRRAIAAGADGFLLKAGHPADLLRAIHGTVAGETWLAPAVARFTAEDTRHLRTADSEATTAEARLRTLAPREREVADRVAEGLTNAEIGEQLFLSESTVKTYLSTALGRLALRNRVELALLIWQADATGRTRRPRVD